MLYKTKKKKQNQRVHGRTLFALYEAVFPFAASPSCGSPDFYDFQGPLTESTIIPHYNFEGSKNEQSRLVRGLLRLRPHVSGYFCIRDVFFVDTAIVHTYIRCIRQTNPQLFESALQSAHFLIRYESGIVWTLNPAIIFYWRYKIESRACFAKVPVTVLWPVSRWLFGAEGKFWNQNRLNSSTVPSSQSAQFGFVKW